ncbi:MAG: M23 family metallopeptidase [Thermacetogeniaceae bacterium]|jgi:murein DD-endopeptidase MepM/ murein hydrolase activator NlpD
MWVKIAVDYGFSEVTAMQRKKAIICCLAVLTGLLIPLQQAAAYFAEDSFTAYWNKESVAKVSGRAVSPVYTVKPGDTLWSISRLFGVSLSELKTLNGIQDEDLIRVGQILRLPEMRTHRVSRGETLWSLSRRYGTSVGQLMVLNQITDPASLKAGQELIIAGNSKGVQPVTGQAQKMVFAWPLKGRITSQYGPRNGEFHHGLDIAGEMGELIRAGEKGVVITVGYLPFYGNTVIIDHGGGYKTLYGHISEFLVAKGDTVEKRQPIARVGSTGRSTGPHLHFEVRINDKTVNPIHYLDS